MEQPISKSRQCSVRLPFSLNRFPANVAWDSSKSCIRDSLEIHVSELKTQSVYDMKPSVWVTKSIAVSVASFKSL